MRKVKFIAAMVMVFACSAEAQEWNQWRGPNRDGVAAAFSPPKQWPKALTRKWRVAVGGGYSSPVISGSRIYVHTHAGDQETVSSLDLNTGKIIWSKSYPAAFAKNQYAVKMDRGPFSTPLIHRGKLYTLGVTAVLTCFDARDGRALWRKDFSKQVDTSKLFCGTAMSPVVDNGRLIVHVGDDRRGWMIAYDAESGKELWTWEGEGPGYSSPIVAEIEGERQIITLTDKSVIGVSVSSGKLLWKFAHTDEWNENIVTPVLHGRNLIVSGVRQGTRAIRVTREKEWSVSEVWRNQKVAMYMSSPVIDGDFLYGLSNIRKGQFFCLDARTGEAVWMTEGREGASASVIDTGKVLFFLTTEAELVATAKGAKGFEQIARYTVADSPTYSHPVFWGNKVLIKDASTLALWAFE
ncbi:MAG: PQQ-binding-like beta-propeller repeat protein [Acidobacteriota bacterium]